MAQDVPVLCNFTLLVSLGALLPVVPSTAQVEKMRDLSFDVLITLGNHNPLSFLQDKILMPPKQHRGVNNIKPTGWFSLKDGLGT